MERKWSIWISRLQVEDINFYKGDFVMGCMGEDRTLVRTVHHEGFLSSEGPQEVGRIIIDALPVDVLRETFLGYHVASYLGNSPWLINVGEDHTHLYISRFGEESKFLNYSDLNSEEFHAVICSARREPEIVGARRIELAEGLLQRVDPEKGTMRMCFHSEPDSRVYSDLLSVLGFDVSSKQISEWIGEIVEREHWKGFREQLEYNRRLNDIPWDSVVGAGYH